VDRETVIEQFDALEKKIEHLVEACKGLKADKSELEQHNLRLSQQLQDKIMAERQHDELKTVVRSKIDSLMGRLDELAEEQN
jgi:cell division protein ZapB